MLLAASVEPPVLGVPLLHCAVLLGVPLDLLFSGSNHVVFCHASCAVVVSAFGFSAGVCTSFLGPSTCGKQNGAKGTVETVE